MFEIGRLCVKLAGRDAGKKCVVVDEIDANYVVVDGETRRRKVNVAHLEPLAQVVDIKKGADTQAVAKALGIEIKATTPKQAGPKPTKGAKAASTPKKPAKASKSAKSEEPAKASK
jgi:large subunit ribosomal protein L14e